jgi:hypothetical protein
MGPRMEDVATFLFSTLEPNERAGMSAVLDKLYDQVMGWHHRAGH